MKASSLAVGALSAGLTIAAFLLMFPAPKAHPQHAGGFDWAIQGKYSQLDCGNQPGKRPDYEWVDTVDADGNAQRLVFFEGCR